ncbi:MAG: putative deoxyhypusine synthase [Candidatus Bathyarchaeota archaeon BA1]|nr:MAG: putative deoxyhypusine synthase [Candidatus Bathyarchaeota archaeon BA1]
MKYVGQMQLRRGMSVGELVDEMKACGVLGAGKIGKAAELAAEMFGDPEYTVFLTIAGPLIPGGLRKIIGDLINQEYVNVVVTTGANMVHDMVEALGYKHIKGSFSSQDKELKAKNLGRIGDIYIEQRAFKRLEKWLFKTLESIPEEKRQRISAAELLYEIGRHIEDSESILAIAARKNVPIICPAFIDSIAGFHTWVFGQDRMIGIDPLLDVNKLMDKVFEAKKVGVIILGGGHPKHFTLFANTFRGGVDSAIQITMDRPEPGGLSGAPLEEAISWGKMKPEGKSVTVIGDATIIFPIIIAAAISWLS